MDEKMCFELGTVKDLLATSRPTKPVDAVIVYSRGLQDPETNERGDDEGLLETAASFVPSMAPRIVINGGDGGSKKDPNIPAWPGVKDYRLRLRQLGVEAVFFIL